MSVPEHNLDEQKENEELDTDASWDDDAYRHRQEHGRERKPLSDQARDRRAYFDKVL